MTATLQKLMDEEVNRGREEGITKGRIDTLVSLVSDGLLTIAQAAAQIGESEQEFSQRIQQQ